VLWYNADTHDDVERERTAVAGIELDPALGGWPERVGDALTVDESLKAAYLSLPYGNGSFRFEEPGYFANVRRCAPEFDFVVGLIGRHAAGGRLLDLGADGTWSTARLADLGFECIALDITDHLRLSRLYRTGGRRFTAVNADMHEPLFRPSSFDVITAFNALHHSSRLDALAANIVRMLVPGGVLGFIEPYVQNDQQAAAFGAPQSTQGINENIHTVDGWHAALTAAGLALGAFALSDSFSALYQKPSGDSRSPGGAFGAKGKIITDPWSDIYKARLSVSPTTAVIPIGRAAEFAVTVTNETKAGWASRGPTPIRLSYHVQQRTAGGLVLVSFDNDRTPLPTFVGPDSTAVFRVPVTLSTPGVYAVEFDLVHETKTWFKDRGGKTAIATLTVV
jgi:SAM-dependent methyltransferase